MKNIMFLLIGFSFSAIAAREGRFQYVVSSLSADRKMYNINHLYINPEIPSDSRIELHMGMRCGDRSWQQIRDIFMPKKQKEEDRWEVGFSCPVYLNGKKCTDYEFVYKITLSNGHSWYDNTYLSHEAFYSSDLANVNYEGTTKYMVVTYGMSRVSDYQYRTLYQRPLKLMPKN